MTSSRSLKLALAATAVAALAACGGGGGSPQPIMFSGKVIDGYIEGAKVCLDLNANQACDTGEPSDTSKAGGGFSLDVSGITAAQLATAHLLTTVPTSAKDADDDGKTLAEAGKLGFSLMAPATAFSSADGKLSAAVISPLTTLVSHDMIAGNNKPLEDAKVAVLKRMGLDVRTDLNQDFVAGKNSDLQKQARIIAAAIGAVSVKVKQDVNDTTDRDALLAALTYLQQNITALVKSVQSVPDSTTQTPTQLVNAALNTSALKPIPATLASAAKQITASSAADIVTLLADGVYSDDCLFVQTDDCSSARYSKNSGNDGKYTSSRYALVSGAWVKSSETPPYVLKEGGWKLGNDFIAGTFTSDGQGGGTAIETGNGRSFRFSARSVDLSDKKFGSVAGLQAPKELADSVFPSGSKLFWMQFAPLADDYRLHDLVDRVVCKVSGCTHTVLASIGELISAYPTPAGATASNSFQQWNNLVFSFNAGGTATGGTVSLWGPCTSGSCQTRVNTGTATYEIRTAFGQQILIIQSPTSRGEYVMFSAVNGQLRGGNYTPAGINSSGEANYNKTALNAILSVAGKPAVVN